MSYICIYVYADCNVHGFQDQIVVSRSGMKLNITDFNIANLEIF